MKIHLQHLEIEVLLIDGNLPPLNGDNHGMFMYDEENKSYKLVADKNLPRVHLATTLIHELMHGIMYTMSDTQNFTEEQVVRIASSGFVSVMNDPRNKAFRKKVLEVL